MYGHTSVEKLTKFLKKSGNFKKEHVAMLEKISKNCNSCIRTQRRKPRPKVSVPRADGPNEIVTVDLKEYNRNDPRKRYICYFIDIFSRFTVGAFIPDKRPEQIVESLLKNWIPNLGLMKGLHWHWRGL